MAILDVKSRLEYVGDCCYPCPNCGGPAALAVYRLDSRPKVLGLPAARLRRRYLGICSGCGARYSLPEDKGRAMEKGGLVTLFISDISPWE